MGAAKRQLRRRVAVPDENGELVWYGPGDKVPADVAKKIINPAAWDSAEGDDDSDDDEGEPQEPITGDYDSHKAAELKAEVERRNADRDPDGEAYIVVGGKGNKPDLVAALEADDHPAGDGDEDA